MSVLKVMDELSPKLRQLNEIDCVNQGGCAIVAYGLREYVKERFPEVNPEVVFFYGHYDEDNKNNMLNGEPGTCFHAVLRIDGEILIDSNGRQSIDFIQQNTRSDWHHVIETDQLLASINSGGWNPWFEREESVPEISEILELGSYFVANIRNI